MFASTEYPCHFQTFDQINPKYIYLHANQITFKLKPNTHTHITMVYLTATILSWKYRSTDSDSEYQMWKLNRSNNQTIFLTSLTDILCRIWNVPDQKEIK